MAGGSRGPASGPHLTDSGSYRVHSALDDDPAPTPADPSSPPPHEPLMCLAPHWSRWGKVVLFVASLVTAIITALGGWAIIGLRSTVKEQADGLYMPLARADDLWKEQQKADATRDEKLAAMRDTLLQVDGKLKALDATSQANGDMLRALLGAFQIPVPVRVAPSPAPTPLPAVTPSPAPAPQAGTAAPTPPCRGLE